MVLTEFQWTVVTAVVFFVALIAGIGYITIPDDPAWPLYIYVIVCLLGSLYWGGEVVQQSAIFG